jgi:hypothetical protein
MLEAGIFGLLSGIPAITAICGLRIYPLLLPTDGTVPAISWEIMSEEAQPTMDTGGVRTAHLKFICWGTTYGSAVQLRSALVSALNMSRVVLSTGLLVQNIKYLKSEDDFDHDALQYAAIVDFVFYFC